MEKYEIPKESSESLSEEVEKIKKEIIADIIKIETDGIKAANEQFNNVLLKAEDANLSIEQFSELFTIAKKDTEKTIDIIQQRKEFLLKDLEETTDI